MREDQKTSFTERLKTAATAKAALLAKFQPKPSVPDADFQSRSDRVAAERNAARAERAQAKADKAQAASEALIAAEAAAAAADAAALEGVRGERKERKALSKAEAKTKRDARYAARQARRR